LGKRLQSDLFCVEWDVKPQLNLSISHVMYEWSRVTVCVRYVSTSVSQSDELPCCGTFVLHQGIQRRIALTVIQDARTDLQWTDVHALTVGCVRNTRGVKAREGDAGILSLNAAAVPCTRQQDDTRCSQHTLIHPVPCSASMLSVV